VVVKGKNGEKEVEEEFGIEGIEVPLK